MPVSEPVLVKLEQFVVMGLTVRTKNEDEFNPQTAKLPQLWEQFFEIEIPYRKSTSAIYGVYSNYESDYNGFYNVTAGVEVSSFEKQSNEFHIITVKKGNYLMFKNSGSMPEAIIETWSTIWSYFKSHPNIMRRYDTDFEVCTGSDECAIYIGISE